MTTLVQRAEAFKALGHPSRLEVLRALVRGEEAGTPVGRIQQCLGIPASTLSHHLECLASVGLISSERDGTRMLYKVEFDALHGLTDYLWEDCCKATTQACG